MKKILISLLVIVGTVNITYSQKLIIGEKSPDLKVAEWLGTEPTMDDRARLIEFFHSSNKQCVDNLKVVEAIAKRYGNSLCAIVVCKESSSRVRNIISGNTGYYTAIDSSTFNNFGVRFVPFCVLVDGKGRIVWFGNIQDLTDTTIRKAIK